MTGGGCFTDNVEPAGTAYACFVRSPHARAEIVAIDVAPGRRMPGVLVILPGRRLYKQKDGTPMPTPERPALAVGRVRHVGDLLAIVVTPSRAEAEEEAAVAVEYRPLPVVTVAVAALENGALVIWPEAASNLALDWEAGDAAAVDRLFADARHVTRVRLVNNRLIPNPLEPRACIALHDPATGGFTLRTSDQGKHDMQAIPAEQILRIPVGKMRVVQADDGGGFGMKIFVFPEYPACL